MWSRIVVLLTPKMDLVGGKGWESLLLKKTCNSLLTDRLACSFKCPTINAYLAFYIHRNTGCVTSYYPCMCKYDVSLNLSTFSLHMLKNMVIFITVSYITCVWHTWHTNKCLGRPTRATPLNLSALSQKQVSRTNKSTPSNVSALSHTHKKKQVPGTTKASNSFKHVCSVTQTSAADDQIVKFFQTCLLPKLNRWHSLLSRRHSMGNVVSITLTAQTCSRIHNFWELMETEASWWQI